MSMDTMSAMPAGVFTMEVNSKVSAIVTEKASGDIFENSDIKPKSIDGMSDRGYVPWGEENNLPAQILEKVRASDVMNPNMYFNVLVGYGRGLDIKVESEYGKQSPEQKKFFRRNRPVLFLWEILNDLKHWFFAVCVVMVDRDGKKITRLVHKDANFCRLESCDPKTGKIENVFFADWSQSPEKG